ncbi:hypothetical protein NDA14_002008 [Ustilago hordei]|nr:hypothetical protein NDA14_002008 [Ustilago hordei]
MDTTQPLLHEQPSRHLSYWSTPLIFAAYLPVAVVLAVIVSQISPRSPSSSPSLLARVFTPFVTPEDVQEYDRIEAEARENDKHVQASTSIATDGANGRTQNGYGPVDDRSKDKTVVRTSASGDSARDSEISPLLPRRAGSGDDSDVAQCLARQPRAVQVGLSLINISHLLAWVAALVFAFLSSHSADCIGAEAGFQNALGLRLVAAMQIVGWAYASSSSTFFPSPTPPYAILIFYGTQLAGSAVSAYHSLFSVPHAPLSPPHRSQLAPPIFSLVSMGLTLVGVALIMGLPLQVYDRNPQHDRNGYPPPLEDYCTLWQWVSFSWLNPIISLAQTRPLEESDVSQLSKLSKSQVLRTKMRRVQRIDTERYEHEKARAEAQTANATAEEREKALAKAEKEKPNILRQIIWINSRDLALDFILTIVSYTLAYASPFFLRQILGALQSREEEPVQVFGAAQHLSSVPAPSGFSAFTTSLQGSMHSYVAPVTNIVTFDKYDAIDPAKKRAFLYAVFALLASVIKTQTDLQHLYFSRRAGVRIKSELTLAIYDKALRRKDISGSLQSTTSTADAQQATDDTAKPHGKDETSAKKETKKMQDDDKSSASVGKVVNLMSTDANSISMTVTAIYMAYSAPVELIIATTFLYKLLGWSAFVGAGPALILMPMQQRFTMMSFANNKELLKTRDKRITVLNELILSIRFIKFFAWERGWSERVLRARQAEIKWLVRGVWIMAGLFLSFALIPITFTVSAFTSYTLIQGKQLDVATGFTAIALFAMLRNPLNILPMVINMIFQAKVSMDRIDAFLHEDEVPDWVVKNRNAHTEQNAGKDDAEDRTIVLDGATLRWQGSKPVEKSTKAAKPSLLSKLKLWKKGAMKAPKQAASNEVRDGEEGNKPEPFQLTAIDFRPPRGKITLICGPTGSGKSSLLSGILGEMELLDGTISLPKRPLSLLSGGVTYCSQTAWLETMSIRDNIVFGQYFDQQRYDHVLECCCLKPDLKTFPDGDQTEIGENGVSLSGGQKARVALARAVYSRSPILLLDDVLAAVDSHTAKKLVDDCLCGDLLRGRTVVLVTHHVEAVLPHVAQVVMLEEGHIRASGTAGELKAEGLLSALVQDSFAKSPDSKGKEAAKDQLLEEEAKGAAVEAKVQSQAEGPTDGKADTASAGATTARGKLVQAEGKSTGKVKREIYVTYLSAFGWLPVFIVLFAIMWARSFDVLEKYWLSYWGNAYLCHPGDHDHIQHRLPDPKNNVVPYLGIYGFISLFGYFGTILAVLVTGVYGITAGNKLFERMLHTVVRSPTRFFDQTPTGRILNRFTKDVETVDSTLAGNIRQLVAFTGASILSFTTMAVTVPSFVPLLVLFAYVYYRTAQAYISAARDLRRLESVTRSPIFQSFSEVLNGIATVRAYGAQERFLETLFRRLDATQSCYNLFWMANRWLMLRFDLLGALIVFGASVLALAGGIDAGWAGIAITQAQTFVLAMYWLCRCWTGFEMDLNSVERMHEYLGLPQEPPAIIEGSRPPPNWPSKIDSKGIQVNGLVLKYAPDLDPVLRGVNFNIAAGEKVGLVGRTGSGKSTLALAFFRFVEYEQGSIVIDGIDISQIGLEDLRSRLTIIPQDPVLFSGTIRDNLDPFNERTDEECLLALRRVNLRTSPIQTAAPSVLPSRAASIHETSPEVNASSSSSTAVNSVFPAAHVSSMTLFTLDTKVSEGGSNFSQGQRQLISMARALLRSTSIIFMDEATASVDFETDTQIQRTLRAPLGADTRHKTTIITIAHRLKTIIDYDRILVMDKGVIVENGSPGELLQKKGIFSEMCKKTGEYEELELIARHAAEQRSAPA